MAGRTGPYSTVLYGTWSQTTAGVPGIGTGTPSTPLSLRSSATLDRNTTTDVVHSAGGESSVAIGMIERTLRVQSILKDWAFAAYALRGTSVQTALPWLAFQVSMASPGPGIKLTDAKIAKAEFSLEGRTGQVMASYDIMALREATATHASQSASSGYGPVQGGHITVATIGGNSGNKLLSWSCSVDNGLAWTKPSFDPQTSGEEFEHEDFEQGPETVDLSIVTAKPLTGTVLNLGELTHVTNLGLVLTFTRGAHTLTFTHTNLCGTGEAHELPGATDEYKCTYKLRSTAQQGCLALTTT